MYSDKVCEHCLVGKIFILKIGWLGLKNLVMEVIVPRKKNEEIRRLFGERKEKRSRKIKKPGRRQSHKSKVIRK